MKKVVITCLIRDNIEFKDRNNNNNNIKDSEMISDIKKKLNIKKKK